MKISCLQGSSNNGTLELLGTASPLLGNILLKTLLVLPGRIEDCENKDKAAILRNPPDIVHSTCKCFEVFVSGIGGQTQTETSIWYYVLHQSSTE